MHRQHYLRLLWLLLIVILAACSSSSQEEPDELVVENTVETIYEATEAAQAEVAEEIAEEAVADVAEEVVAEEVIIEVEKEVEIEALPQPTSAVPFDHEQGNDRVESFDARGSEDVAEALPATPPAKEIVATQPIPTIPPTIDNSVARVDEQTPNISRGDKQTPAAEPTILVIVASAPTPTATPAPLQINTADVIALETLWDQIDAAMGSLTKVLRLDF